MSKLTGVAVTTLSVDDSSGTARAMIGDVTNFQFSTPRGVQDMTGVNKSAMERGLLLADFSITLNGVVNDTATTGSHAVLSTVPSSSTVRQVTFVHATKSLVNECLFTDYSWNRGQDGSLTFTAPGVLADGTVPTWT